MGGSINKVLVVISLAVCVYFFTAYGKESYPFYGDAMGYYMYLPSTFIYHNHKALDWLPADKHLDGSVRSYLKYLQKDTRTPKGYIIDKYTYGVAAMEMPFFFIAHGYEKIRGREANGYSAAYRIMLKVSSLFYALLGLIILYKVLTVFFNKNLSLTATLIILMGTNLFWFAFYQAGMAHVPLFFLYALLIYATIRIHKKPVNFWFIVAGLAAGFITLIRPADIICLLIPLLYNVYNKDTITKKMAFIKQNYKGVIAFIIACILPLIPQMLYWKKFAGSYMYYSYGKETFNWLDPHIFAGLFSFSNGWLIYTPVMVFSLLGFLLYKRIKPFAWVLLILFPVYTYMIYSWYCYYYINGLGSRPMINIYPLLERKFYWKFVYSLLFLFFMSLNISYSLQEARGILISEESNSMYNFHMLYKMNADYKDLVLYDVQQVQPEDNAIEKVKSLACENYEDSESTRYVPDLTGRSKYVYHMQDDEEYHPKTIIVKYNKELFRGTDWLKCSGTFLCTRPYLYFKHILTLDIRRGEKTISWSGCKIDNKIGLADSGANSNEYSLSHLFLNKWGNVYFFVKVPQGLVDGDQIRLDVWNIGKQEMFFDNICLELYKNKK